MVSVQPDGSSFKQDLHRLGQGVDTLKSDMSSLAHGAADTARSGVAELRDGAKEKVQAVKTAATSAAHSVRDVVVRHPVASLCVAASVSLVFGMFLARRRG